MIRLHAYIHSIFAVQNHKLFNTGLPEIYIISSHVCIAVVLLGLVPFALFLVLTYVRVALSLLLYKS